VAAASYRQNVLTAFQSVEDQLSAARSLVLLIQALGGGSSTSAPPPPPDD